MCCMAGNVFGGFGLGLGWSLWLCTRTGHCIAYHCIVLNGICVLLLLWFGRATLQNHWFMLDIIIEWISEANQNESIALARTFRDISHLISKYSTVLMLLIISIVTNCHCHWYFVLLFLLFTFPIIDNNQHTQINRGVA